MSEPGLFELPQRYLDLQAKARQLAADCADIAARADEADSFDPDVVDRLRRSGLTDVVVDAAYGGRFEKVDSLAVTVVREALCSESAHLDSVFAMQGIGSFPLSVGASERIREEWLPKVATLEAIGALCLTEPDVGSDLRAVSTSVVEKDGELVVNGHKSFITNAGDATFYSVLVREDDQHSLVFVPADTPGVSITHPHQIIAPHVLGDVIFEDVRVPLDHRLGEPGKGFKLMLSTLATFRVSVAGAAVGLAQAALEEAIAHATTRHQFGKPLAELGAGAVEARGELDRHRDGAGDDLPGRRGRGARPAVRAAPLVDGEGRGHRDGRPGRRPVRAGDGPVRAGARRRRSSGCTARPGRCGSTRAPPRSSSTRWPGSW